MPKEEEDMEIQLLLVGQFTQGYNLTSKQINIGFCIII